jgi:hypothetical protein
MALLVGVSLPSGPPVTPTQFVQRLRLAVEFAASSAMASLNRGRIALPHPRIEGEPSMQGEAPRDNGLVSFTAPHNQPRSASCALSPASASASRASSVERSTSCVPGLPSRTKG